MLTRIVKMSFEPSRLPEFLAHFETVKEHIRAYPGNLHLQLLQDQNNPSIIFTYSVWESESHLEAYRQSPLFESVWNYTKKMFNEAPQAWSTSSLHLLP